MGSVSGTSVCHSARALPAGGWVLAILIVFLCGGSGCSFQVAQSASTPPGTNNGETIVLIRHGEIPAGGLGQLSCMGLNRSLELPNVLIDRFGRPAAIFAPDPADQIKEGPSHVLYSYVRPLATIEPTAIELGLPVSTQLSYQNVTGLQETVTAPEYADSTVFIAWEHGYANRFARQLLRSYDQDPSRVPPWPGDDFDRIYVFHIAPESAGNASPGELTFQVQQEGLDSSLSNVCPNPQTQN